METIEEKFRNAIRKNALTLSPKESLYINGVIKFLNDETTGYAYPVALDINTEKIKLIFNNVDTGGLDPNPMFKFSHLKNSWNCVRGEMSIVHNRYYNSD